MLLNKYLKYKNKYLNIKYNQYGSGNNEPDHLGINFEGGKIIKYILNSPNCIGYTNIQIAMDAPFLDAPAGENVRTKGPTETQLLGYDEKKMLNSMAEIFKIVIKESIDKKALIVIQIARGRSGIPFWEKTVKPYLSQVLNFNFETNNVIVKMGYRTSDYFDYTQLKDKFIFVNIGMFGRLDKGLNPGNICIPVITYDIIKIGNKLIVTSKNIHKKDLAFNIPNICKLALIGIADDMPFITPDLYKADDILNIFKYDSDKL